MNPGTPRPRVLSVEVTPASPPRSVQAAPSVGYVLARFLAFAIDFVVVTLVATEFAYSLIAINPFTGLPTNSEGGFYATLALGAAVALVYVWLAEAFLGSTLGKLAFGLHVFVPRGHVIGLRRALIRSLLRPIDLLVVGGILALLPARKRLGDLAAGTVVGRSPLGRYASAIGVVAIVIVLGLPFVTIGVGHTFAAIFAFVEFVPRLAAGAWAGVHGLIGPH
jgi:uncharacterized RDD family membrane protein YckC